jgi:hypothetical protein
MDKNTAYINSESFLILGLFVIVFLFMCAVAWAINTDAKNAKSQHENSNYIVTQYINSGKQTYGATEIKKESDGWITVTLNNGNKIQLSGNIRIVQNK